MTRSRMANLVEDEGRNGDDKQKLVIEEGEKEEEEDQLMENKKNESEKMNAGEVRSECRDKIVAARKIMYSLVAMLQYFRWSFVQQIKVTSNSFRSSNKFLNF